jgi:hypothetical protein
MSVASRSRIMLKVVNVSKNNKQFSVWRKDYYRMDFWVKKIFSAAV